jgi:hypothetical protein
MKTEDLDVDVIVVGAGPAGMAGAETLATQGLRTLVVDEQSSPGGQIWRGLTRNPNGHVSDPTGIAAIASFLSSGAQFSPETRMWQIQPMVGQATGWSVFLANGGRTYWRNCRAVLLATGAQERPTPLKGWTLPGVMTVGAAQIMLKTSSQIPTEPVWIVGTGPLPLLYMTQLLGAGGKIAGYLDTGSKDGLLRALPCLAGAISGDWRGLVRGLAWKLRLSLARVSVWHNVTEIVAHGDQSGGRLEAIGFRDASGRLRRAFTSTLLVHRGLIPQTDITRALDCRHDWVAAQRCFVPRLDDFGMASTSDVFVAGDAAGIAGADAAALRGRLAAIGILQRLTRSEFEASERWQQEAVGLRRSLRRLGQRQRFLDTLFPPPADLADVNDDVLICRCEEVHAGTLRQAFAEFPDGGPDEIKIRTRCGMGACQGRQCGDSLTQMFAAFHNRPISDVKLFRSRPPLRPVSLSELADLDGYGELSTTSKEMISHARV